MEKVEKFLDKYIFVLAFIFCLPAFWSLLVHGMYGSSDDLHVGWLFEMNQIVKILQIPPRYVPDLSYGFGYPLFNYVFPLPFLIAEVFHLIGLSLVDSLKAVFLISFPLSFYFMYKLLKYYSNSWLALLGSVIYVFTPYRSTDVFVRGAVGEIMVFVFIPLITLATGKIVNSTKVNLKWVGIGGIALACLIMSHNISAYMFFPFLILLLLINLFLKKNRRISLVNFSYLTLFGLLISSFFWVPAIAESGLVKYDTVFNYADHFPTIRQFFTPYFGYGASVAGPYDGMSFFWGIANIVIFVIGLISIVKIKLFTSKQKTLIIWALLSILISSFMMNFRSKFLWDNIPLIPYFQFPWRFLSIITFSTSLLVIVLEKLKLNWKIVLVLSGFVIIANFSYFKPHDFLSREDSYFINRYIPVPEASSEYKKTGEEYLRLPVGNEIRPDKNYPRFYSEGNEIKLVNEINSLSGLAKVSSNKDFVLNYNKYNFPGWVATVDDKAVAIVTGKPYGQITLKIPSGEHRVRINFKETPFRFFFDLLSLISFVIAIFMVIKFSKKEKAGG